LIYGVSIALFLTIISGVGWKTLRGRGIRMQAVHRLRAVLNHVAVEPQGNLTNVVFLHHSVGRNLIDQGQVRPRLAAVGFRFWDHDYNWEGLVGPDGTRVGYSYLVPGDNTDPDGLARLFAQPVHRWPINAFSGLMQHEVIAFKSCFPASDITSDKQLTEYKAYYWAIRDVMDRHPDRVFIVVTPPPLNPAATTPAAAARARAFADWLRSDAYLDGHPNVFTFDLFDLLAERDASAPDFNMLRAVYREGDDSHPNRVANETIGPLFVDFIVQAAKAYRAHLGVESAG